MRIEPKYLPGVTSIVEASPYEVETKSDGTVYKRWTNGEVREKITGAPKTDQPELIVRVKTITGESTIVRTEKTWAPWSRRTDESLVWYPINAVPPRDYFA